MQKKTDYKDKKINSRLLKGKEIIAKGKIPKIVSKERFLVPSQNSDKKYTVDLEKEFSCNCPDFKHNKKPCKHIYAVLTWLEIRSKLAIDTLDTDKDFIELQNEIIEMELLCPYCNSINVIKDGTRQTNCGKRQKYFCKACKRRFVVDPLKGRKATGKLIALCMDLYYKGLSYRKIADTMYQFYGIDLHHETIRRWINKFMKAMNKYVEQFKPELGKRWQVDEQKVRSDGDWVWCWNAIDNDTRFLIANSVTLHRSDISAKKVFKRIKEVTSDKPEAISTDGLTSYRKAIKKEMGEDVVHIKSVGITDRENNNRVERYHGSWRERDKIMRGLGKPDCIKQMMDNYRLYYNFLRSHQGLDGITPAERAGINLNLGRNRWMGLIEKTLNYETNPSVECDSHTL